MGGSGNGDAGTAEIICYSHETDDSFLPFRFGLGKEKKTPGFSQTMKHELLTPVR